MTVALLNMSSWLDTQQCSTCFALSRTPRRRPYWLGRVTFDDRLGATLSNARIQAGVGKAHGQLVALAVVARLRDLGVELAESSALGMGQSFPSGSGWTVYDTAGARLRLEAGFTNR